MDGNDANLNPSFEDQPMPEPMQLEPTSAVELDASQGMTGSIMDAQSLQPMGDGVAAPVTLQTDFFSGQNPSSGMMQPPQPDETDGMGPSVPLPDAFGQSDPFISTSTPTDIPDLPADGAAAADGTAASSTNAATIAGNGDWADMQFDTEDVNGRQTQLSPDMVQASEGGGATTPTPSFQGDKQLLDNVTTPPPPQAEGAVADKTGEEEAAAATETENTAPTGEENDKPTEAATEPKPEGTVENREETETSKTIEPKADDPAKTEDKTKEGPSTTDETPSKEPEKETPAKEEGAAEAKADDAPKDGAAAETKENPEENDAGEIIEDEDNEKRSKKRKAEDEDDEESWKLPRKNAESGKDDLTPRQKAIQEKIEKMKKPLDDEGLDEELAKGRVESWTYAPGDLPMYLRNFSLLKVFIPAKHLTTHNKRVMRSRQIWGTDVYTEDSDFAAVVQHMGIFSLTSAVPNIVGINLIVRTVPGQKRYPGSRRNGLPSRTWNENDGQAFVVKRATIVDLSSSKEEVNHKEQQDEAKPKWRVIPNVTVCYNLSNDPCLKYCLPVISDRGPEPSKWTCSRLKAEVLFVEDRQNRYEIARATDGEDKYKISKVLKPRSMDRISMDSMTIPLPDQHIKVIFREIKWGDIAWTSDGMTVQQRVFPLQSVNWVVRSEAVGQKSDVVEPER